MDKVFIVEDEPMLRLFYTQILEEYGFEVLGAAKNGDEAISMFEKFPEKPLVIIMDYRMPIKNGIEALQDILKIDKNTKIIIASADTSIKEKVLSLRACSFKEKPFDIDLLVANVQKACISSKSLLAT